MTIPAPLACDGVATYDPATQSLLVKVVGFGASFWRRGHAAMVAAEEAGRYGAPSVYAHAPGRPEMARGEPVQDGWLRFKLSDADYQRLAGEPLSAIVTVDQRNAQILAVKFLGR